ncbi:hypothetical protein [Agrobacterium sp. 22-210-1]
MRKTIVQQDGADFYYRLPGFKRVQSSTAPMTVSDFDVVAAETACTWFVERECPAIGIIPEFE